MSPPLKICQNKKKEFKFLPYMLPLRLQVTLDFRLQQLLRSLSADVRPNTAINTFLGDWCSQWSELFSFAGDDSSEWLAEFFLTLFFPDNDRTKLVTDFCDHILFLLSTQPSCYLSRNERKEKKKTPSDQHSICSITFAILSLADYMQISFSKHLCGLRA